MKDSFYLFKSDFMSLTKPHPIWTSAGCSPFEVKKATVQARMLSGRNRTCWFRQHWSGEPTGCCKVLGCTNQPGTLQHLATGECPRLHSSLVKAVTLWKIFLLKNLILFPVIKVDPTTQPPVLALTQTHGTIISEKLCYMTRTWLFYMHKETLKLLQLWN